MAAWQFRKQLGHEQGLKRGLTYLGHSDLGRSGLKGSGNVPLILISASYGHSVL
jgi:hypothetical protein